MSQQKLEGYTLPELLEIALVKAKNQPIQDQVPLSELLLRVKFRLKDKLISAERERIHTLTPQPYSLMHPGGKTQHSQEIEELLNLDRILSGLSPLLFNGRSPLVLTSLKSENF